jgi:hypothetical protein
MLIGSGKERNASGRSHMHKISIGPERFSPKSTVQPAEKEIPLLPLPKIEDAFRQLMNDTATLHVDYDP